MAAVCLSESRPLPHPSANHRVSAAWIGVYRSLWLVRWQQVFITIKKQHIQKQRIQTGSSDSWWCHHRTREAPPTHTRARLKLQRNVSPCVGPVLLKCLDRQNEGIIYRDAVLWLVHLFNRWELIGSSSVSVPLVSSSGTRTVEPGRSQLVLFGSVEPRSWLPFP